MKNKDCNVVMARIIRQYFLCPNTHTNDTRGCVIDPPLFLENDSGLSGKNTIHTKIVQLRIYFKRITGPG
jgi:hypothetical protein